MKPTSLLTTLLILLPLTTPTPLPTTKLSPSALTALALEAQTLSIEAQILSLEYQAQALEAAASLHHAPKSPLTTQHPSPLTTISKCSVTCTCTPHKTCNTSECPNDCGTGGECGEIEDPDASYECYAQWRDCREFHGNLEERRCNECHEEQSC